MPYVREKPVREFLGFVAPGKEHLLVQFDDLQSGPDQLAAGDHGRQIFSPAGRASSRRRTRRSSSEFSGGDLATEEDM